MADLVEPVSDRGEGAEETLTSEIVFARLEQLRELLRLTDYLRELGRAEAEGCESAPVSDTSDEPPR